MKKLFLIYLIIFTFLPIDIQANTNIYYFNLAEKEYKSGNFEKAIDLYNKSMALTPKRDIEDRELLLNQLAVNYMGMGEKNYKSENYTNAILYYEKALKVLDIFTEKTNVNINISKDYIAFIYFEMGKKTTNIDEALKYCEKALRDFKKISNTNQNIKYVLSYMGLVYAEKKDFTKAKEVLFDSLDKHLKEFGRLHRDTATIYHRIGYMYSLFQKSNKAENYYKIALEIREKILDNDDIDIATSYHNLGELYHTMYDYKKALKYYQKSLTIHEKVLGKNNITTAMSYNNLGDVYHGLNNYSKALEYLSKALNMRKKILGEKHAYVARSYNNLGILYNDMGEYPKALEYYMKSLDINEELLGKEHLTTVNDYNNLGKYHKEMGNFSESLKYHTKSLAINIKKYGEENGSTALVYNSIGQLYYAKGDFSKALEYYTKSLNIRKKIFPKEHMATAISYNDLGTLSHRLGDYTTALEYYTKSLNMHENLLGENHIDTARVYNNIGEFYRENGEYAKALKYQNKSLKIREKVLGVEHIDTATNYNNLALIYFNKRDYPKALEYHNRALKIKEKILGKQHLYTALSYNNIGLVYFSMGVYPTALEYYQKSLTIREKVLGKEHPSTAIAYNSMAQYHLYLNEYAKALKYYKKALVINEKILGKNHIDTAMSYGDLAMLHLKLKDYNKALKYNLLAVNICEKALGMEDTRTAVAYNNLGIIYSALGNKEKALYYYQLSLNINNNIFGKNHLSTIESNINLVQFYKNKKEYDKAYKYAKLAFDIKMKYRKFNFSILNNREKIDSLIEDKSFLFAMLDTVLLYNKEEVVKTAFNSWLNYKRALFNEENSLKFLYDKTKDNNVKSKIDELFSTRIKLAKLHQNIPQNSKDVKKHQNYIKTVEGSISDIEKFLSSKMSNFNFQKISYQDISKNLKPKEIYIDFAQINNIYYGFALDKNNNIFFQRFSQKDSEEIDTTIKIIQNETNKNISTAKKRYGKLYKLLFKNINIKNRTSLIISPDGLLNTIPFEAFYDGEKYLIEKLNIRYIPSGKEFVKLYENNSTSNSRVVVFANPDFGLNTSSKSDNQLKGSTIETLYSKAQEKNKIDNYFKPLSNTDEPNTLKKLYGKKKCKPYLGKEASESNFFKIKSPKILHLSTHGFYLRDKTILNPMLKAGIALSGANEAIKNQAGDGIITALELSGMDLSHTELVVLSACKTGIGELEDGEGVAGINKAFMKAGAKYIVMALWSVPEKSTGLIMKRFYENLNDGKDKTYSEALRDAKIWMITDIKNSNPHPFYWAGFVGSGRDE